jgi:hypothetical protein
VAGLRHQVLVITVLFLFLVAPFCNVVNVVNVVNAVNYERVFRLVDHPGGSVRYSLTVSVLDSLYRYYVGRNHDLYSSVDFAKFITPYAVKPIADVLRSIYSDDEVFADAVLSITHQITYEVHPEVYPVETLFLNKGDCGGFSLLVASVLKAGGLDVVLFEYPSMQHLNVGVSLSHKPTYVRGNVSSFDYNGKRYYMAESTGDNFPEKNWRVGECPQDLKQTTPNVVSVENYDHSEYGQVSATPKTLSPSQISIFVSSSFVMENSVITVSGVVSPSSGQNITIYVSPFGGLLQVLATVEVGADGHYVYSWRPTSGGIYYLEASWSGNEDYAGADSGAVTLYVIPFYGLVAGILGLLLLVLMVGFWIMNRRGAAPPPEISEKTEPPPPPSPEEPQKTQEETQPQPSQTPEQTTQTQETKPPIEETTQPQETQPSAEEPQSSPPQPAQPAQETTSPPATEETAPPSPTPATEPQQTQEPQPPIPPPPEEHPSETPSASPTENPP